MHRAKADKACKTGIRTTQLLSPSMNRLYAWFASLQSLEFRANACEPSQPCTLVQMTHAGMIESCFPR